MVTGCTVFGWFPGSWVEEVILVCGQLAALPETAFYSGEYSPLVWREKCDSMKGAATFAVSPFVFAPE